MDKLVLVHLSDIHFTRSSGVSVHDLDANVRNELRLDAIKLANVLGSITGVLVTGDIAFSGNKDEYKQATDWLSEFCSAVGCAEENVWVVPGNHDVDRSLTTRKITRTLHQGIRKDKADIDEELREILSDEQSAGALLAPLAEYNTFARRFGCSISPEKHYWERDLRLRCGTAVRLRGLTSTLVSNADDKRGEIVLGAAQVSVARASDVLYVTLCHHPPDWLRDYDCVDDHLKSKVHIQLFGHKHSQRIDEINGKVRLVAGAMHPERGEREWVPTYNFLEISRRDSDQIGLRVYQRRWSQPDTSFVAERSPSDGKDHREFIWSGFPVVPLEKCSNDADKSTQTEVATSAAALAKTTAEERNAMPQLDYERRLTYRFLKLAFRHQFDIAQSIDVLTDDDGRLSDEDFFREVFKRAKGEGLLARLWEETEKRYTDAALVNPFENLKQ